MISRRTSSVPKGDVVLPRLLYCDSRCSQSYRRHSQVCPRCSQVLPGMSSALPVTLKAGRNALLGSDTLQKLMHLSLHSTSSETLLDCSSDWNTFCWCAIWTLLLFMFLVEKISGIHHYEMQVYPSVVSTWISLVERWRLQLQSC
jgi:hypothetical protein